MMKFEDSFVKEKFKISEHAKERLLSRFGCSKGKFLKVACKAWKSKEKVDYALEYRKKKNYSQCVFKSFCGNVFVFAYSYDKKVGVVQRVLVTVFHPKKEVLV